MIPPDGGSVTVGINEDEGIRGNTGNPQARCVRQTSTGSEMPRVRARSFWRKNRWKPV